MKTGYTWILLIKMKKLSNYFSNLEEVRLGGRDII